MDAPVRDPHPLDQIKHLPVQLRLGHAGARVALHGVAAAAEPRPAAAAHSILRDDLIVLPRIEGPPFGLEATLELTAAVRGAVMAASSCVADR